ncbi:TPA: gp53-like domain-containing protein [Escherichia coli]
MHRIDTKTAQKDKFGAGKNGFTRGNPQTGTPATDLDDDYFDMLQEELCSVVEASGASLEKARHDQLLTALRALLLSRKNPFGDIKSDGTVETALENLGLGEAAKRNVGTGENQIPDMSSYASGSGWRKMPDGSIEQWGRISFPGEHGPVSANVSFPIPFTQTPGIVIVCDGGFGGGNMWGATNWSTTGFIAHCNYGLEGGAFFAKGW